jgi:putative transposase
MPNYRRAWVPGGCYFFTVALAERKSSLLTERIHALRQAVRCAQRARPFRIDAFVILPNHLHCIWTLPPGDAAFATRWAHIKSTFSRSIPCRERIRDSRILKRERGIWQRRYWEHLVRDERDLHRHIDYVHFNPVKHGLVSCVSKWPWSTFHRYVRRGILPADWSGEES